jgi:hypothetical protein
MDRLPTEIYDRVSLLHVAKKHSMTDQVFPTDHILRRKLRWWPTDLLAW